MLLLNVDMINYYEKHTNMRITNNSIRNSQIRTHSYFNVINRNTHINKLTPNR
jgi:hypothetical protein